MTSVDASSSVCLLRKRCVHVSGSLTTSVNPSRLSFLREEVHLLGKKKGTRAQMKEDEPLARLGEKGVMNSWLLMRVALWRRPRSRLESTSPRDDARGKSIQPSTIPPFFTNSRNCSSAAAAHKTNKSFLLLLLLAHRSHGACADYVTSSSFQFRQLNSIDKHYLLFFGSQLAKSSSSLMLVVDILYWRQRWTFVHWMLLRRVNGRLLLAGEPKIFVILLRTVCPFSDFLSSLAQCNISYDSNLICGPKGALNQQTSRTE